MVVVEYTLFKPLLLFYPARQAGIYRDSIFFGLFTNLYIDRKLYFYLWLPSLFFFSLEFVAI